MSITGTFCVVESPDHIAVEMAGLRERYLLAILKRDAEIWHARTHKSEAFTADVDDAPQFGAHAGGLTDDAFTEKRAPKVAPLKRILKKQAAAIQRAKDEKRIAEFVATRHTFLSAAKPRLIQRPVMSQSLPPPRRTDSPKVHDIALAAGQIRYQRETPCIKCGSNCFYVSDRKCIECTRNRRKRLHAANKLKRTNAKEQKNRVATDLETS